MLTILLIYLDVFDKKETTGIQFSPDGMHLYFQIQDAGILFDVTRKDGRSFAAKTLNIKARHQGKRMRRE